MPFFGFTRKKKLKEECVPEELKAIEKETSSLLERITAPTPSPKRPRKVVGRVTIEVLDSVPLTPSTEAGDVAPIVENAAEPTTLLSNLDEESTFKDEETRVCSLQDTFVPALVPSKTQVEAQISQLTREKERLERPKVIPCPPSLPSVLQQAPEIDFDIVLPPKEQNSTEAAAIQIQAVARGYVTRRVQRSSRSNIQQNTSAWQQVHDAERGETWYYNSTTGQSQWEPPLSLPKLSFDKKSTLPVLPSHNNQASVRCLPSLSPRISLPNAVSSSITTSTPLPSITKEPRLVQDADEDDTLSEITDDRNLDSTSTENMVDWMDNDALFLADGSKNNKLRDTIRDALKISKFDSVSSLLTSNVSFNQSPSKRTGVGARREIALGRKPEQYMVAVIAKDKNTKRRKAPSRLTTPIHIRIRDVADSGFIPPEAPEVETRPMQNTTEAPVQCFACWSAIKGCKCEAHTVESNRPKHPSESALMCSNWEVDQLRRKYRAEEIQEVFMEANSSLRYDKVRKTYITVVECRHPIYRAVEAMTTALNKTMRRKLHVRSWFRSFLEHLRLGRVKKSGSGPSILKARETLRNAKWCTDYSKSVLDYQPKAPITTQRFVEQPIEGVISIHPANPSQKNWVLKTECPRPYILYQPRKYDLLPRRCIPMPQPSFLDQIPLPVANQYLDSLLKVSWFERVCARISLAAMYRGIAQVKACTPRVGFDLPRRTRVTPPTTVLFASFGRKATPGNLAVGGLCAEMLIYMVVTTFIPPQFGNFTVTDRRPLCPPMTQDHNANYYCLVIDPTTLHYVVRPLEHPLNSRRPPTIMLVIQGTAYSVCTNRPEQTGEDADFGFITTLEWSGLEMPEETKPVTFVPHEEVLSFNIATTNATVTTRADRYYPFCEPTTRESTIVEFIHLLWMGKSSRNQPQCFTNLGSQDPGEYMKNCNVNGAMGTFTPIVYRSWAYMQTSPFEEFVTDDGIAYWYERATGRTFWERPILEIEKHRGPDADIEGDMAMVKKQLVELKAVNRSANKHVITKPRFEDEAVQVPQSKPGVVKINVPKLKFEAPPSTTPAKPTEMSKPFVAKTSKSSIVAKSPIKAHSKQQKTPSIAPDTKKLIETLTSVLGSSMATQGMSANDVLQLGIGLGMGLGLSSDKNTALLQENDQVETTRSENSDDLSVVDVAGTTRTIATTRTEISLAPDMTPDELAEAPEKQSPAIPFGTTYLTHSTPGEGENWVDKPCDYSAESQTAVEGYGGAVHRSVAKLPKNFVQCASSTKTVKSETNYLPTIINKNQPRCVGIVKPRTAADEWLVVGYDPWVAGKELFNLEFVKNLKVEDEEPPVQLMAGTAYIDKESHAARQEIVSQAAKEAMELEHIMSLARHGKYAEVENLLNQPDWSLPIDAKDSAGNTLLSIACQNNNKRIAKLCLRK
ncbi:hypothetical protein THRCLA_02743, partial [Thraustotheca clavata]